MSKTKPQHPKSKTLDNDHGLSPGIWLIDSTPSSSCAKKLASKDENLQNLQLPLHLNDDIVSFFYEFSLKNTLNSIVVLNDGSFSYCCPSASEFSTKLLAFLCQTKQKRKQIIKELKESNFKFLNQHGQIVDRKGNVVKTKISSVEAKEYLGFIEAEAESLRKVIKSYSSNISL